MRTRFWRRTACGVVVSLTAAWAVGASTGGTARREVAPGDGEVWRTQKQQGTNALHLLLKLCGRSPEYDRVKAALEREGEHPSLLHLRDAAAEFGLPCEVSRVSPGELGSGSFPVVTLMDLHPDQGGVYVLLVNFNGTSWQMIDGTSATLISLSDDEFRRNWSGVVLTPRPARSMWPMSLAVGLAVLALYVGLRVVTDRRTATPETVSPTPSPTPTGA